MHPRTTLAPVLMSATLLLAACGSGGNATADSPDAGSSTSSAAAHRSTAPPPSATATAVPTIPGGRTVTGKVLSFMVPGDWKPFPTRVGWQQAIEKPDLSIGIILAEKSCGCTDTATPDWVERNGEDYLAFDKAQHPTRLPNVTIGGLPFFRVRYYDPTYKNQRNDIFESVYRGRSIEFDVTVDVDAVKPKAAERLLDQIWATVRFQPAA